MIYVLEEQLDGKWIPATGGGSSTRPRVRAFNTKPEAERALKKLNYLRGFDTLPKTTPRRIAEYKNEEEA